MNTTPGNQATPNQVTPNQVKPLQIKPLQITLQIQDQGVVGNSLFFFKLGSPGDFKSQLGNGD